MFYTWLHMAYAVLLCAAIWLNRACWRGFVLSLIVGIDLFLPIPWTANPALWYFQCFLVELMVILGAICLSVPAAKPVAICSILLSVLHLTGVFVGPVKGFGFYRSVVPGLEITQILSCVALSHSVRAIIRRRATLSLLERF